MPIEGDVQSTRWALLFSYLHNAAVGHLIVDFIQPFFALFMDSLNAENNPLNLKLEGGMVTVGFYQWCDEREGYMEHVRRPLLFGECKWNNDPRSSQTIQYQLLV